LFYVFLKIFFSSLNYIIFVRITQHPWTAVRKVHRRNSVKRRHQRQRKLQPSFRFRSICQGVDGRRTGTHSVALEAAEGRVIKGDLPRRAPCLALTVTSVEPQRHSPSCSVNCLELKIFIHHTMVALNNRNFFLNLSKQSEYDNKILLIN